MTVGGAITGSGAGFLKTNYAAGAVKVHIICAGDGFPLIEPPDLTGDITCEAGYEHGIMIGCLCCAGRPDSAAACYVCCASGPIDPLPISSDAPIGTEISKTRAVHKPDGKITIEPLVSPKDPVCREFAHEESLGRMEDTIGAILSDDSLANRCYHTECTV